MWLLDANVDMHVATVLKQWDISCDTAGRRGWRALSNGELVARAFEEGFRCLLTRDRLFGEAASQALKKFPDFAIVVITLPQARWPEYRQRFLEAWAISPIQPVPSRVISWPAPEE